MPWGDGGLTSQHAGKGGGFGSGGLVGGAAPSKTPAKKGGGGGFWGDLKKYSGADLVGNLAKDVGSTAVGVGPGLYHVGRAGLHDLGKAAGSVPYAGNVLPGGVGAVAAATHAAGGDKGGYQLPGIAKAVGKQYADYYGHDLAHHLYTHPLQPILDAATIADLGSTSAVGVGRLAAKAGAISDESRLARLGERATIKTRSPRNIATGKGPVHTNITSTKPLVKGRALLGPKIAGEEGRGVGPLRVGGEVKRYGKQIQSQATRAAMGRMAPFDVYTKATKGLSHDEWVAMHIRAMDIHPADLKELWHGTPDGKLLTPKVEKLALSPSKRMVAAEPHARMISQQGAALFKEKGLLKDETAAARAEVTKQQAAEALGRPVKEIHGEPYYFPHTMEPARNVNPLKSSGGGKAVPRAPGSTKQNLGVLALHGKLHLRSDVLGPEFLRRVKYVKYDEIHNALVRGSLRMSHQDLVERHGGMLPKGYEYVREKASTRIPPTARGEGDVHTPISKLIPNPEDLHDSQLAKDGFSTTDPAQAHVNQRGQYHIIPKTTAKAATGEFTRSGDLTRALIKRPLSVWRSAVLGLRVGFFTNNFVGNSLMYAMRTGGRGAIRDLFGAIMESHGRDTALKILKDPATPPAVRTDLYKEFFPEQIGGTFGKTQSPSTSAAHLAGQKVAEGYRNITGAIPRITSKVAEEYPRRALIRNEIRHSPEFKQAYAALPKQTRTFEEAARNVLTGKGGKPYQRFISKQVNQALGDYLNLSPFERNVMRNALPFYSWYRAIVQTTYHLAADTPLRAEALAMIGRVGAAGDTANVPSFLKGAIPLGEGPQGTKRVLGTQGLNPYATLEQLGHATKDYTSLGLNPFLEGPMQYLQYHRGNISPGALIGAPLLDLLKNLPPSRLLAPPGPSKLYPTRKGRGAQLPGFLGVPVKEYNPGVAAQQARQGR